MIKVLYGNSSKIPLERKIINAMKKLIIATINDELGDAEGEVSLTICTNEKIRELNNEHRGIDRETDVLSFPTLDFEESDGYCMFGDVVISIEKAKEQAEEYGHSLLREMCFLCVHSALHLLGYDHVDDEEGRLYMESKQEEILSAHSITR